jgi:hypothetical protein
MPTTVSESVMKALFLMVPEEQAASSMDAAKLEVVLGEAMRLRAVAALPIRNRSGFTFGR